MPKFKKGESGNPKGKPKGSQNKVTKTIKEAIEIALNETSGDLTQWLKKAGKRSGGQGVFAWSALAEYVQPKLSRTEVTGKDGEDLSVNFTETIISKKV